MESDTSETQAWRNIKLKIWIKRRPSNQGERTGDNEHMQGTKGEKKNLGEKFPEKEHKERRRKEDGLE